MLLRIIISLINIKLNTLHIYNIYRVYNIYIESLYNVHIYKQTNQQKLFYFINV